MPGKIWRSFPPVIRSFLLVLFIVQLMASSVFAIDRISETRWGFNGKVALNRFNMLSVLVNNPLPTPYEGMLSLRKKHGMTNYVDATIIEPVTLAPFSSKWIQFYPYIGPGWNETSTNENWELSWGRGDKVDVPEPHVAKYQRIILDEPGAIGSRVSVLKHLPENLFPAFVSATDALQVVAMDREPRTWIPGQKEAFLDWLSLGGTVVLLAGPTGKIPEFTGPLSVLNSPLENGRFGTGRIIKTSYQRSEFTELRAKQFFASLPKNPLSKSGNTADPKDADSIDDVDPGTQIQTGAVYSEGGDPFVSSSFLTQLKDMTKPEHNWVLLHLMFWVYIAMVFPGCYLLGKRWSDFRIVYGGLLGTVALFSFLFSVVGQRGYGESTAVHTVAIARALPGGAMDVSSWSNVFVTSGANYKIKHNGRGALYSTCSDTEEVRGLINNGVDAEFLADIPPFSTREFALRMRIAEGAPTVKLDSSNTTLQDLSLVIDGIKPDHSKVYTFARGRFYSFAWRDNAWKLSSDTGDAASMLNLQQMQQWKNGGMGYNPYGTETKTVKERFDLMFIPLLSRSLNVARESDVRAIHLPDDIVRVYVYTQMPPAFGVQNENLGVQEGYVLYCIDVPLEQN